MDESNRRATDSLARFAEVIPRIAEEEAAVKVGTKKLANMQRHDVESALSTNDALRWSPKISKRESSLK